MAVKLTSRTGNYDRQTNRQADRPTDQTTDGHFITQKMVGQSSKFFFASLPIGTSEKKSI